MKIGCLEKIQTIKFLLTESEEGVDIKHRLEELMEILVQARKDYSYFTWSGSQVPHLDAQIYLLELITDTSDIE